MSIPKKTLIIHDRFMFRGGAERLILNMAHGLNADIATGFWSESETFPKSDVPNKLFILGNTSQKSGWRYAKFQFLFYFKTKFIHDYDLVIFSGNNCLSAAHNVRRGVKKIFYCHTPVRHAYDLKEYYLKNKVWWKRIILNIFIPISRLVYQYGFRQMDTVIANSNNVKDRLMTYLKRDSIVINCPIETDKFTWASQKDYYLSFARVDKLKRVSDIVRAFQKLPDKKLIVASGGDDLENVKALASGHDNIKVLGWVDDKKLAELVGNCIASIYIPIDEDFGMTPLESMSAGKPCIGVREGGLKETIIDGQTGKFIPAKYKIEDIINAVNWMSKEKALSMKEDCIAQALKFSKEKFIERIKNVIKKTTKKTIAIDASRLQSDNPTGVEHYSTEIINGLKQKSSDLILYTPDNLSWPIKKLWSQLRLGFELLLHPPDIFFTPSYIIPFIALLNKSTKKIVIIHDIAFVHSPESYSIFQRWLLNLSTAQAVRYAYKIITPTRSTKDDLIKHFNCPKEKIEVTHFGYTYQTISSSKLRKKQILFLGRVESKKNIDNLVKAFKIFYKNNPDYKLILAGKKGVGYKDEWSRTDGVEYLGYISEEKKQKLLQESSGLALVSKYEGFGIPVLEAFASGLPVIASDIAVLREIGGNACLYVSKDSVDDIARGIDQIIKDLNLRDDLIAKGKIRLKDFNWTECADKTWHILNN